MGLRNAPVWCFMRQILFQQWGKCVVKVSSLPIYIRWRASFLLEIQTSFTDQRKIKATSFILYLHLTWVMGVEWSGLVSITTQRILKLLFPITAIQEMKRITIYVELVFSYWLDLRPGLVQFNLKAASWNLLFPYCWELPLAFLDLCYLSFTEEVKQFIRGFTSIKNCDLA